MPGCLHLAACSTLPILSPATHPPNRPPLQHAINAFRAVAELPASYIYNMTEFPEFRYLIENVPEKISECGWAGRRADG